MDLCKKEVREWVINRWGLSFFFVMEKALFGAMVFFFFSTFICMTEEVAAYFLQ